MLISLVKQHFFTRCFTGMFISILRNGLRVTPIALNWLKGYMHEIESKIVSITGTVLEINIDFFKHVSSTTEKCSQLLYVFPFYRCPNEWNSLPPIQVVKVFHALCCSSNKL